MDAEIAPGVHRIDTALGERLSSLYLFVGPERALLFDTGVDGSIPHTVVPYITKIGLDPQRVEKVIVSHCNVDHCGGAKDVEESFPAATLIAHGLEADAIEDFATYEHDRAHGFVEVYGLDEDADVLAWAFTGAREAQVGARIAGAEVVDLGDREVEILQTPGHSHGHLPIHDPANSLAAISDVVLGDAVPLASGAPVFPPTYRYVEEYLASIDRLGSLAPSILATAHYGVFRGPEVGEFLDRSEEFAQRLRQFVLDAVPSAPTGMTLAAPLHDLNQRVGSWSAEGTMKVLTFPVVGHIEQLVAEGALCLIPDNGGARIEGAA